MHEHSTAKMRKYRRMKFFCIISACPAGAREWHISYFAVLLYSKSSPKRGERNPAQRRDFYCFPSLAKYLNVIGHRIPANRITMKYRTP